MSDVSHEDFNDWEQVRCNLEPGATQVFRLDTHTFRIERVQTGGDAPGGIFKHRALLVPGGEIRVFGGYIDAGKKQTDPTPNKAMFALDPRHHRWTRISTP